MKKTILLILGFQLFSLGLFAQTYQRSYGDDVATHTQTSYSYYFARSGVAVYTAWVNFNGNTEALSVKIVNRNNFPVIITWQSLIWGNTGISIDQPGTAYSDEFAAGEEKDGLEHKPGMNGTEVYGFRPNWLYFQCPRNNWPSRGTSININKFEILDINQKPIQ